MIATIIAYGVSIPVGTLGAASIFVATFFSSQDKKGDVFWGGIIMLAVAYLFAWIGGV